MTANLEARLRGLAASLVLVLLAGCTSAPAPTSSSGSAPSTDSSTTTELPGDVGKSCSAGCDKELCIVTQNPSCLSGDCLFDGRGGLANLDSYCTGDCRAASCPSGFVCQDVPAALTGESLRRCTKDGSAPTGQGDAGPTSKPATLAACEYTLDGCGALCGRSGKSCSTRCTALAGAVGQTFASEASCKSLSNPVDTLTKCGGASVADWKRCCCE